MEGDKYMPDIDTIYNQYGEPRLRLLENDRLVDFDGKSIGFIDDEDIYDYNGNHRGWYIGGLLRDHNGDCVGFGEEVTDTRYSFLPFKDFGPFPGFVEFEPFRPFKELAPYKPFFTIDWSTYDPISLFMIHPG